MTHEGRRLTLQTLKSCSKAYACYRDFKRFVVYSKQYESPGLMPLFINPDRFLTNANGRYLKNHEGSIVGVVNVDNRRFVIKRYDGRGVWYFLKRAVRRTKASRSWINAHRLLAQGIPTAPPVAVIENRLGPIRLVSYYVSEYMDAEPCNSYFTSANVSLASKARVTRQIVEIFQKLARARISHGDTKATNIIIHDTGPLLMDLDVVRMHRLKWRHRNAFARDVRRFLRNWESEPQLAEMFKRKLESIVV